MFNISYTDRAKRDIAKLKRNEPDSFQKAVKLLNEIVDHPRTGTGHPEPLKGGHGEQWSRRITQKHRLVYEIRDCEILVLVLTAYGHYDDK